MVEPSVDVPELCFAMELLSDYTKRTGATVSSHDLLEQMIAEALISFYSQGWDGGLVKHLRYNEPNTND